MVGKEAVKTGSKIAARYSASTGEVLDDAMMELSWGSRALFLFRELGLFSKEQIWLGSVRRTLS